MGWTISKQSESTAPRFEPNLLLLEEAQVTGGDIIVCSAWNYADSLAASALNKPLLLVDQTLSEEQKAFLDGLPGDSKYYVIGGTSTVSDDLMPELAAYSKTVRVSGTDRCETSVNVAQKFFGSPNHLVLVYSQNFPDGICAIVLAVRMNAPLLMAATENKDYAAEHAASNDIHVGTVIGTEELISDEAVKDILGLEETDPIAVKQQKNTAGSEMDPAVIVMSGYFQRLHEEAAEKRPG